MAREPSELDDDESASTAGENDERAGNNGLLDRRAYLKMAGTATAALATAGASGSAAASEYRTITVGRGDRKVIRVRSGQTLENVLIDQTAPGAASTIMVQGGDVRNVGIKGRNDNESVTQFGIAVPRGETSTISNVYCGDGGVVNGSGSEGTTLMWGDNNDHHGTLKCEYMYVDGWGDNAFYFSGAGPNGGDFHVDRCYVANTRIAAFRFGTDGCSLTNSVCENMLHRGVWVWYDKTVDVENCVILANGGRTADGDTAGGTHAFDLGDSKGNGGYVNLKNVSYDSRMSRVRSRGGGRIRSAVNTDHNPKPYVPDGVPTSAVKAAGGERDGDAGDGGNEEPVQDPAETREHVLLVDASGQGSNWEPTSYAIEVDGELEPSEYDGASVDPGLVLEDGATRVEHTVANWKDAYAFDGDLVSIEADGPAVFYLDDEEVDLATFGDGEEDDGSDDDEEENPDEHALLFDASGQGPNWEPTRYAFEVDGELEPAEFDGASIDPELSLEDGATRVEHSVANWKDAFTFTGNLVDLSVDGPAVVYLDGEVVDPDDYGKHPLEHLLVIEGSEEDSTRYEFSVSGEVEKSNEHGEDVDDDVVIEDGTVHSVVGSWTEAFRFSGDLEELYVHGPATVRLDGQVVDPADYGEDLPTLLEVEGRGFPASFELTVDGTIATVDEDGLTIADGSTVESAVVDGVRRFRFSGALTDVTFTDGIATVRLDGEEIDPEAYGDQNLFPHAVVIDGTDANGPSSYSFEIDGRVIKSDYKGASIDAGDLIDGRSVSGSVANWLDAFWFDGDVTDLAVDGDAKAHVEYNARDQ